jgi:hypothetical protein
VIKINANEVHPFWQTYYDLNPDTHFEPIILDGERVKFQFKGNNNPFECYPPVEGCEFRTNPTSRPISFIDMIKPGQISYNIAKNRANRTMIDDLGIMLAINKGVIARNNPGKTSKSDPLDEFYNKMYNDKMIEFNVDRELIKELGNVGLQAPQVVNASSINEAIAYHNLAEMIKSNTFELVGITRQRLGQQKASETATGIQGAINYSESQTEIYFNQFSNELMPRVYQRMIEAAQYYTTINKNSKIYYMNNKNENILFEIENLEGLLRDYNVLASSTVSQRVLKEKLTQLFLSDNTINATALERAQVLTSDSVNEIMENLRLAQISLEQKEEMAHEREMEKQKAAEEAMMKQMEMEHKNLMELQDSKNQSAERAAAVRAMAGIQTDVNANQTPDAYENVQNLLKGRELDNKIEDTTFKNKFLAKSHNDKIQLEKDKLIAKSASDDKKLAISIINKNKSDDEKLNNNIAKMKNLKK